jgi:hypothetical protein
MTDDDTASREVPKEPPENQERKPKPQNEPVDPLGSGCGLVPGEGI